MPGLAVALLSTFRGHYMARNTRRDLFNVVVVSVEGGLSPRSSASGCSASMSIIVSQSSISIARRDCCGPNLYSHGPEVATKIDSFLSSTFPGTSSGRLGICRLSKVVTGGTSIRRETSSEIPSGKLGSQKPVLELGCLALSSSHSDRIVRAHGCGSIANRMHTCGRSSRWLLRADRK